MADPERLYHYTCDHGRRDIGSSNCLLLPHMHVWLGFKLLWLTDLDDPSRESVGLTMDRISCDRLRFRYVVDSSLDLVFCRPWLDSTERGSIESNVAYLRALEDPNFAHPEHWWIVTRAVHARFDRTWVHQAEVVRSE